MGLTESLIHIFTNIIHSLGYPGVALLMAGESMILPIPSEAVMPFAGFLWNDGTMTFIGILVASTAGSIIGSLISYWIGAVGGKPFIQRFGKFFLLNEHHLELTQQFFIRNGEKTIFFSRFIPVVRHLISIPAGVGRMNLGKFTLYTIFGAAAWNAFLAYVGYVLGSKWEIVRKYSEILDIIVVIGIIAVIVYFFIRRRKRYAP